MATTVGLMQIRVGAETQTLKKDLAEGSSILANFTGRLQTGAFVSLDFFQGLGMVTEAARTLTGAFGSMIMASADQSEATDLVRVQFGKYADVVIAGSDEMADKFGTVKTEFLSNVGTLEGVLGSMGKGGEETANLAVQFGKLAVDMESAFNSDFAEEMDRIRSGLTGSAEPLQRYGVNLLDSNVKQEAYRMGLAAVGKELTESQKITARTSIIFRDLNKIMDNKELTSGSTANKVKELGGRFENLQADVGGAVEIIANGFLVTMGEGLLDVMGDVDGLTASVQEWARESIQSGGMINEVFGVLGEGVAFTLDNISFGVDALSGFIITTGNILTGVLTSVIDLGIGIGEVFEGLTGVEIGFLDTTKHFRDALDERNAVLLAHRDTLFQGSSAAESVREFIGGAQSRLDEIGRATPTIIEGVERTAVETVDAVKKASKLDLADASTFGSTEALSAINRASLTGSGKDEGVKVQRESLTVEKQSLAQLQRIATNLPRLDFQTLELA